MITTGMNWLNVRSYANLNAKLSIERWASFLISDDRFFSNFVYSFLPKSNPKDCPRFVAPDGYIGNKELVNQVTMEDIIDKAKRFEYNANTSALLLDFKWILHNCTILKNKGIFLDV